VEAETATLVVPPTILSKTGSLQEVLEVHLEVLEVHLEVQEVHLEVQEVHLEVQEVHLEEGSAQVVPEVAILVVQLEVLGAHLEVPEVQLVEVSAQEVDLEAQSEVDSVQEVAIILAVHLEGLEVHSEALEDHTEEDLVPEVHRVVLEAHTEEDSALEVLEAPSVALQEASVSEVHHHQEDLEVRLQEASVLAAGSLVVLQAGVQ